MSRTRSQLLRSALYHFCILGTYAAGDLSDQLVIDAICMRLSAGIETLASLDATDRDRLFGEQWPLMWGIRNRIAHGYALVDTSIIRQTIQDDIPAIVARIEAVGFSCEES